MWLFVFVISAFSATRSRLFDRINRIYMI